MVIGAFPAAKLGALLLRQISKPIANVVKDQAKSSPVFRKYVCMPPAQFYNWCEVNAKMWILNLGKPVNIPVLNEAMAIELGANLLGEGIIFVIAAVLLIAEYNRSSRKEAAKEAAKQQDLAQMKNSIVELFIQTEEQAAQIRELMRKLGYLDIETKSETPKSSDPPKAPASDPSEPSEILPSNGNEKGTQDTVQSLDPRSPRNTQTESEKPKSKKSPDPPKSPPPSPPSETLPPNGNQETPDTERNLDRRLHRRDCISPVHTSLIFKALNDLENQFWDYPLKDQENAILIAGLYHLNTIFMFNR